MKIFDILDQLITTGNIKYSDSVSIQVTGDFKFELQKKNDHVRLAMIGDKTVFAVTKFGNFSFAVEGIKFYPDKYIVEISGWTDPVLKYSEGF